MVCNALRLAVAAPGVVVGCGEAYFVATLFNRNEHEDRGSPHDRDAEDSSGWLAQQAAIRGALGHLRSRLRLRIFVRNGGHNPSSAERVWRRHTVHSPTTATATAWIIFVPLRNTRAGAGVLVSLLVGLVPHASCRSQEDP